MEGPVLDRSHDPARRSWVDTANRPGSDFPIQNLPLGVFTPAGDRAARIGMAIGDQVLDLAAAAERGLLPGIAGERLASDSLNAVFADGAPTLGRLRALVGDLLDAAAAERPEGLLRAMAGCRFRRPTAVGNYTDFYAGIHHARAAGALLTPDDPLPANYKWVPIAYHGRASSVQASGTPVRRPLGQRPPAVRGGAPGFGPCERLDLELEMAVYVGPGNDRGRPILVGDAGRHIVGFGLLNDWSARDIQRWEMFPLGPFLAKSFATSVSPWVVTAEALAPFRVPAMARPDGDPAALPYLQSAADQAAGGLDVRLEVRLATRRMREAGDPPEPIIRSNARYLYWTPAQMVAHHTINGCDLQPGDVIGTGTISGPTREELGSLLELTRGGAEPATLRNGEQRRFLEDGDEVVLSGRCERAGFVGIGFGTCAGVVEPAPAL